MEFKYLGTSTAEGLPTMYCKCEVCERSRRAGGRAIRTRTQAMIDGRLVIDFPPESNWHFQREGICLADCTDVLITHAHQDHLYFEDIAMLQGGCAHPPKGAHLTFHGSEAVEAKVLPEIQQDRLSFHRLEPFVSCEIGGYTVTPLPATHDPKAGPLFYQISDGKVTILYAHDTCLFKDEVWEYWKNNPVHFDFVSLDCTYGLRESQSAGHMNFEMNKQIRAKMYELGLAGESTIFACNHFSHNGGAVAYDDFMPVAAREGFMTSFDGMTLTI